MSLLHRALHGENLEALRQLRAEGAEPFDLIYIDPPYNTGDPEVPYADRRSAAAWTAMMRERLAEALPLLRPDGALAISINHTMLARLQVLLEDHFRPPLRPLLLQTVLVRHPDRILRGDKPFQDVTEFLLLLGMPEFLPGRRPAPHKERELYQWRVQTKRPCKRFTADGTRVRVYAPGDFELVKDASPDALKRINIRGTLRNGNSSGRFFVRHLEPLFATHRGHLFEVEGIGDDGLGRRFFLIPENPRRRNGDYFQGRPRTAPRRGEGLPYPSFVDFQAAFNRAGYEGGVRFRWGKKPLAFLCHVFDMAGLKEKPRARVLDFFAGSGSAGHALMEYNVRDAGERRCVLVEREEHFETVLRPRLERAGGGWTFETVRS